VNLSVVIITLNEEVNIRRTLESVLPLVREAGEIIVVDSGSTDRTVEIARELGAKVYAESWKGFARQKNSALEKATCDWVLSLDADEAVEPELAQEIQSTLTSGSRTESGYFVPRKNFFLGRWIKRGGFWPDRKLRLIRRGMGQFEDRPVHEDIKISGATGTLNHALLHYTYPTLTQYIATMNKYSSLGAEMLVSQRPRSVSFTDIVLRPLATFIYNYFFRLGFLDGREGLLLHLYHSAYVSWKYAKAWELSRDRGR
jgi:glycosyltransferase involved in cell wall biosynthesis